MSNNPTNVSLDVSDSASNGGGWTNVVAANGATYSYLYAGGNQPGNDGSVAYAVGGGNAAVTLVFADGADPRYRFVGNAISFQNDSTNQLSTHGNAPRTRVINDSCTAEVYATYKVLVTDTMANTTIQCDPTIHNHPA